MWADSKKKIANDIDLASKNFVDVIVQYGHAPSNDNAAKSQNHNAVIKKNLDVIKGVVMSIPADQVSALVDEDSDITFVSPDRSLQSTGYTDAFLAVSGDLSKASGWSGQGVTVAVVDSGIGNADDLKDSLGKSRILYSQDFTGQGTDDQYGHGTHVAGIIGGTARSLPALAVS